MPNPLQSEKHPVLYGLLALLGVATVVGLITGLAALAGARVLGVDEGTSGSGSDGEVTMYLPKPQKTKASTGPQITLAPGQETTPAEPSGPKQTRKPQQPRNPISLSVSQTAVAPMEQVDLTGVYPGGEGAILRVQRFENGGWEDFPVTVSVGDQTFATYVQTSQTGVNRFRVVDTGTGKASNDVRVTVG